MGFSIQEIQGSARINGGERREVWFNNTKDGSYLTRTPNYEDSTVFIITRWPGGKHCLGGYDSGVGLTYTANGLGAIILTEDDQSCIPVTLTEVPCDIRSETTNCIKGNTTEALTLSPADANVILNASIPVIGRMSGHS